MRDGTRDDYKSCRENWADGRCIGCRHHEEPPEFLNLLLKALAGGS